MPKIEYKGLWFSFWLLFSSSVVLGDWVEGEGKITKEADQKIFKQAYPNSEHYYTAGAFVFVVDGSFQAVSNLFQESVSKKYGVEGIKESKAPLENNWLSHPLYSDSRTAWSRRSSKWKNELVSNGIDVGVPVNSLEATTDRYNLIKKGKNEYSQMDLLIYDGSVLLGGNCTIAVVSRSDYEKTWGLKSVHDPLSFGYDRRARENITSSEYEFLSNVILSNDFNFSFYPVRKSALWYDKPSEFWSKLKSGCHRKWD